MKDSSIKERLAGIAVREKDGSFKPDSFDLWLNDSEKIAMDSGGYGLFSTAEDYAKFLQIFVSDEPVLLKKETIDEMFRPQLPSARWLRENALDPKLIPVSGNIMYPESPANHGLGFTLADEDLPTGCKSGSGQGGGLTKYVPRTSSYNSTKRNFQLICL
jgi:CubicO group peptidase (beta-lactamase class C family)